MLQRQNITMPLAQGVDTKTDQKQVVAGKLLELENGTFTTLKTITKRNGSVGLNTRISNRVVTNTTTSRPPDSNAELWFKMDEIAAPLVNSGTAGSGATLAAVGTTTEGVPLDALTWATKSARVDTFGSAYSGSASLAYDPLGGQTKGTVSLWVDLPVGTTTGYGLVERAADVSSQFFIYINNVGGLPKLQAVWNYGVGGFATLTGPDITPYIGQPLFVALVRDAEDLWLYVNGMAVDSGFFTADPTPYATSDGTNTGTPNPILLGTEPAVYSDFRISSGATSEAALFAAYRVATVPATTTAVQRISSGVGLASYGNELLLADGESIYSYDQGAQGWTDKGTFVPVSVSAGSVVKDAYQQTMADGATHAPSGLQAYAWEDSSAANSVRYSIIDGATGQTVLASALLSSSAIKPRVLVLKNNFLFYWFDPAVSVQALKLAVLPVSTPTATPTVYVLTSSGSNANSVLAAVPNYDACIIPTQAGDQVAVVFNNGVVGGGTTVRMYDGNTPWQQAIGATQATIALRCRSVTVFPTNTTAGGNQGPTVALTTDNNIFPYTATIWSYSYSFQLASVAIRQIATGLTSYQARMLTGCQTDPNAIGFTIFYSFYQVVPIYVSKAVVDSSYTVSTTTIWQRDIAPIAKAFNMNGTVYLPVTSYHQPDVINPTNGNVSIQSSYFLIDASNNVVAKVFSDSTAADAAQAYVVTYATPLLAGTSFINDTKVRIAALQQVLIPGSILATQTNVSSIDFDFGNAPATLNHAELANNLHTSGGFVWMYDGIGAVEHNFHQYPTVSVPVPNGSGYPLQAGTYYYTACYEWVDNQGNIHQSKPADFRSITITTGQRVTLTIPYLQLTAKRSDRPVQIVVYRTLKDGTIFYRVSSLTAPDINVINGGSATLTFNDATPDSSLRLLLYTQPLQINAGIPAEVDNQPAPPTDLIVLHRNRLWVVDSTDKLSLWYSKLIGPATPVAFNDGFVKQVDPRGGLITALATVDDKLLVFKGDRIFFIVGQGPTNTDQNNDLSDSILITTDCGCIDPRSVVGTPVGIMFQSRKGIYLIDRSLQVQYIGAPVEAYNNEVITSAALLARTNQVRFTLESGKTLLYDYLVNQWGTFTNQYAVDSIIWQGDYLIMRANGKVLRETPGVYLDDGVPYSLKIATSWLSFANIQGFQRVRRMLVLGGQEAPGQLQVSVCVDFDDTIVQQALVTPAQPQTFGSVTPYGGGLYGGQFQLYQWRVDLARQKTQAVKFVIEDLPSVTATALNLTSLAFEVGAKQGLNKVPASQTVS
jgi:hypothetical protein